MAWPEDRLPLRVELAFGHSASETIAEADWTDVSDFVHSQQISITRGRSGEAGRSSPGTATLELDNQDGRFTPDHPSSPYWPNIIQGTPCRISVAPTNALALTGKGDAALADDAQQLAVTGDIDVRLEAWRPTWRPERPYVELASQADFDGDDRAWTLLLLAGGYLEFSWSPTGADPRQLRKSSAPIASGLPSRQVVRVTADMDNGAGGNTATFWTGPTIDGPWTMIGRPITESGTSSIHDSAAVLAVGDSPTVDFYREPMRPYRFQLRDGIDGPTVADADFTTVEEGATAWTDAAGLPWHLTGNARIEPDWRTRLYGAVGEWAPVWPHGDLSTDDDPGESTMAITVAGILRRLEQSTEPLASPLRHRIQGASPLAYWPFEDPPGSATAATPLPDVAPAAVRGLDWAARDDVLGSDLLPVAKAGARWKGTMPYFAGNRAWCATAVVVIDSLPTAAMEVLHVDTTCFPLSEFWIQFNTVDGTPTLELKGADTRSSNSVEESLRYVYISTAYIGVPIRVHLAAEDDPAGLKVTAHLVIIGGGGNSWSATIDNYTGWVRSVSAVPGAAAANNLVTGHVSVFAGTGSTTGFAQAANAYAYADMAYRGEAAGERIARVAAESGIPITIVGDPADSLPMAAQERGNALSIMDKAIAVDGGILGEARDAAALVYHTGDSLLNRSHALVLDAGADQITNPLAPVLDDQRLRNDVTLTRRGGSSARATDEDSISARGRYSTAETLDLHRDSDLARLAEWRLHLGTWPGMRYTSASTDLSVAPEIAAAWSAVDFADTLAITGLPPQHPDRDVGLLVTGYTESLSPTSWTGEAACLPAGPFRVGVWSGPDAVNHSSAGASRWDATYSELNRDADLTGEDPTGIAVISVYEDRWTTDPADLHDPDAGPLTVTTGGVSLDVLDIAEGTVSDTAAGLVTPVANPGATTHTAPAITMDELGLVIGAWCAYPNAAAYTPPEDMELLTRTNGNDSRGMVALAAAGPGAAGPWTATYAAAAPWAALSIGLTSTGGLPRVTQWRVAITAGDNITLQTSRATLPGRRAIALHTWGSDGETMSVSPSSLNWKKVGDSGTSTGAGRIQAWTAALPDRGTTAVTFPGTSGVENHAVLIVIEPGQVFTVQPLGTVRKILPLQTPVTLAEPARYGP